MPPETPQTRKEPITARISEEASRRLRVASALENLSTGQMLDRILLETLPPIEKMVGQAWDYNRRRPYVPEPKKED
jgi:hypothetical protein